MYLINCDYRCKCEINDDQRKYLLDEGIIDESDIDIDGDVILDEDTYEDAKTAIRNRS